MLGLPTAKQHITAPLCLITILLLLEYSKPFSSDWLGFMPELIWQGEIWRAATGQLLHTNFNHLVLNVSGVLLIWALHGEYYQVKQYILAIIASLVLTGIGLVILSDDVHYAGLSGVLHSMLILGSIIDIKQKEKTGWLLLLGVIVKVLLEISQGASEYTKQLIQADVAVHAHVIGCVAGAIIAFTYFAYCRTRINLN